MMKACQPTRAVKATEMAADRTKGASTVRGYTVSPICIRDFLPHLSSSNHSMQACIQSDYIRAVCRALHAEDRIQNTDLQHANG